MAIKSKNRERAGVETVVGEGSRLEGRIVVADGIRVDGIVMGRLEVGGSIRIGRTGEVAADVKCEKDVVVAGRVQGNLTSKGEIRLESSAVVVGDVVALLMVVEEGAVLRGQFTVGADHEDAAGDGLCQAASG